ncbi:hypothetical protein CK203_082374 [Vitis vinifera]|uniref:Uncharacterized protein n=1 Tax=Vitis vinifera TaxID=29760 RepID=A0A438DSN3_VITVI|nr:hypothetical protein CK203_082374 [Vitis vinifera]
MYRRRQAGGTRRNFVAMEQEGLFRAQVALWKKTGLLWWSGKLELRERGSWQQDQGCEEKMFHGEMGEDFRLSRDVEAFSKKSWCGNISRAESNRSNGGGVTSFQVSQSPFGYNLLIDYILGHCREEVVEKASKVEETISVKRSDLL